MEVLCGSSGPGPMNNFPTRCPSPASLSHTGPGRVQHLHCSLEYSFGSSLARLFRCLHNCYLFALSLPTRVDNQTAALAKEGLECTQCRNPETAAVQFALICPPLSLSLPLTIVAIYLPTRRISGSVHSCLLMNCFTIAPAAVDL